MPFLYLNTHREFHFWWDFPSSGHRSVQSVRRTNFTVAFLIARFQQVHLLWKMQNFTVFQQVLQNCEARAYPNHSRLLPRAAETQSVYPISNSWINSCIRMAKPVSNINKTEKLWLDEPKRFCLSDPRVERKKKKWPMGIHYGRVMDLTFTGSVLKFSITHIADVLLKC